MRLFRLPLLILVMSSPAVGQVVSNPDSMSSDTDSVVSAVRSYATASPWIAITRDTIDWMIYNSLGSLLRYIPGVQMHEIGEYGHPAFISHAGSRPQNLGIQRGMERINDLINIFPDHEFIPVEAIDSISIPPQYAAFFHGGNGKILTINIHEKKYNTPRPFSRIRHVESASEYLFTDAIFSANTGEHTNIMLGLSRQSLGTTGNSTLTALDARLPNAGYESWNLRGAVNLPVAGGYELMISDHYDHRILLTNGGINPQSASILDADTAFGFTPSLVNQTMRAEVIRNRVEAGFTIPFDTTKLHLASFDISYTSNVRYFRDLLHRLDTNYTKLDDKLTWDETTVSATHRSRWDLLDVEVSALVTRYQVRSSPYLQSRAGLHGMARSKIDIHCAPRFRFSFLGRYEHAFEHSSFGYGAGFQWNPDDRILVWIGASNSARIPSLIEMEWLSPRFTRSGPGISNETMSLFEGGFSYKERNYGVDGRIFHRLVKHVILLQQSQEQSFDSRLHATCFSNENGDDAEIIESGATLGGFLRLGPFFLDVEAFLMKGTGNPMLSSERDWIGSAMGECYYRNSILDGALELRTGLRAEYSSGYKPYAWNSELGLFLPSDDARALEFLAREYTERVTLDLFIFAKVKSAVIHFIFQNLLDTRYITAFFYPMQARGVRFGVSWTFLD